MSEYPINPATVENNLRIMLGIALADRSNVQYYNRLKAFVQDAIDRMRNFANLQPGDPADYCNAQADRWEMLIKDADELLNKKES